MAGNLHHRYRPAAVVVLLASAAWAQQGRVVAVVDGDTIDVLFGRTTSRIRLNGIDAPEKAQPFGTRAREALGRLCFGKTVSILRRSTDRYGRIVADVVLPGGTIVNQQMVRDGFAWWFRRYAPKDTRLRILEEEARNARRGLWADSNPIPPWDWRTLSRRSRP